MLERLFSARFGVSAAELIKFRVFCDVTPHRLLKVIDFSKALIFSETSVSIDVSTVCNIKEELRIVLSVYFTIRHSSCLCAIYQVRPMQFKR